jgi:Arc/MetJ-type ribon-helix-helix transcriptional regulator
VGELFHIRGLGRRFLAYVILNRHQKKAIVKPRAALGMGGRQAAGQAWVEKKAQIGYIFGLFLRGKTMEKETMTVAIPASLHKKIEEVIKGTPGASVSAFVVKVLRERLAQDEKKAEAFSQEDEEKVKERLKALGYID